MTSAPRLFWYHQSRPHTLCQVHFSIEEHAYLAPKISGSSHTFTINTVKPRPSSTAPGIFDRTAI